MTMTMTFYDYLVSIGKYNPITAMRYCNLIKNQIGDRIPLSVVLTGDIDEFPMMANGRRASIKSISGRWRPAVKRFREYHEYVEKFV